MTAPAAAYAQRADEPLEELEGVGVTEKLDAQIPLDLAFTRSDGTPTTLRQVFTGERPVILTMNYSNCPMLCSLQLNAMVSSLKGMQWTMGEEYEVVTVSLDPAETPEHAAASKKRYVGSYGRAGAERGWTFLVGAEQNIRALADSIGFGYRYHEERKEYLHQAALMVMTPQGHVSRYLYGLEHSPQTVRLSLVEAAEGKFATTLDKIVLFCFHYDAATGQYTPVARNLMRLGGGLTALLLGVVLGGAWLRESRRRKRRGSEGANANGDATASSTT